MARYKNSVQFTPDHKILCKEIDETQTVDTHLPFNNSYTVFATEFIETDDATNIIYGSDKKITAYRFEEDVEKVIVYDPATYASSFTPTVTYSASNGFTITNLNKLLEETNTLTSNWSVGIVVWHNAVCRNTNSRIAENVRRKRTTWGYVDPGVYSLEMNILDTGVITNTTNIHTKFPGNRNDRLMNDDSFKPSIGIRLRYNRNTEYRTLYSDLFFNYDGTSISKMELPKVSK